MEQAHPHTVKLRRTVLAGISVVVLYYGIGQLQYRDWVGVQGLPRTMQEEQAKLSLNALINADVVPGGDAEVENQSYRYLITLGDAALYRPVIRHELYHVAAGHCERKVGWIKETLWYEPQATLYAVFDIDAAGVRKR